MPLHIAVCIKQVLDPETPASAFKVDRASRRVVAPPTIPPLINSFDEVALEAALRIKDVQETHITAVSAGPSFDVDVMRRALALGADQLVLVQDDRIENTPDSYVTARILASAVRNIGEFDLVLCGRQASDWDNGQVPAGVAELLGLPCVTFARGIEHRNGALVVERFLIDQSEVIEAPLPSLVTVSSELGQVRYPVLRAIMAAKRIRPTIWTLDDIGIQPNDLESRVELLDLQVPQMSRHCQMIAGRDEPDAGTQLAMALREAGLI